MAETVGDVCDERVAVAFGITEQAVDSLDDYLDDVDVLPLVEASDIVGLGNLPFVEDKVNGAGMILDIEPVAHVLPLAVDGERLAVADVVDEQWYQLLRKLVGPVVVRAVGHDCRHAIGVMVGADKMV